MKIVLFGRNGQLGRRLLSALSSLGPITAFDRKSCDISDRSQVKSALTQASPDLVINAAAFTRVDEAEINPEACRLSNVDGPKNIALEAAVVGAALIHYSTDYVFDGFSSKPYIETDAPNPQNVYGRRKLDGELAIQETGLPHIILRIGWLYSSDSSSFLSRVIQQFREKDEVSVIDDQIGAPTSADFVAEMTYRLLEKSDQNPAAYISDKGGLYHLGCRGEATWFEFAGEILKTMKQNELPVATTNLRAISSDTYPSTVKRPAYSKLNVDKWLKMFELEPMQWQDDLSRIMEHLE